MVIASKMISPVHTCDHLAPNRDIAWPDEARG
jgi:hypothetical protein